MNNGFLVVFFIFTLAMGLFTMGYVIEKCGAKGLLFGDKAFFIAASGMCDEK